MSNAIYQVEDFCPHLGMIDDRASSYAYPNGQNACYAVEPACPVRLEQQARICLSGRYKTCSLHHFRVRPNGGRNALPAEVIDRALVVRQAPRLPLWQLAAAAILIAALLAAWLALPALREAVATFATPGGAAAPSSLEASPSPTSTSPQSAATVPISAPPSSVSGPPSSSPPSEATLPLTQSPSPQVSPYSTVSPSPSPRVTRSSTPLVSSSACSHPSTWVSYAIHQGDTLFQLSQLTGTTVATVLQANCLQDGTVLSIGQVIYLPRQPQSFGQPTAARPTAQPTRTQAPPPTDPPPTPVPPTATQPPPQTDPPPPTDTAPPPTPRNTPTIAPTLEVISEK